MYSLQLSAYFGTPPPQVAPTLIENAKDLLKRVSALLSAIDWQGPVYINSGYRSPERNKEIRGAPHSLHMQAKAIDISDTRHHLYNSIMTDPTLLEVHGLWMEDKSATPSWVHLDTGTRADRPVHIFYP